jgi:hypothetical protein
LFSIKFERTAHIFAAEQELTIPVVVATPQTDHSLAIVEGNLERHIALMAYCFGTSLMDQPPDSGIPIAITQATFGMDVTVGYFDLYGSEFESGFTIEPNLHHASKDTGKESIEVAYTVGVIPRQVLSYG